MDMQDLNLKKLQGEWFCYSEQKLIFYFKIDPNGTYLLRNNLEDLMWSGKIALSNTERNKKEIFLENFTTIELWHISGDNEIDLKIDNKMFTFKRIVN